MKLQKKRTNELRHFHIVLNNKVVGQVFAVYKTRTQYHWEGKIEIDFGDRVFPFVYEEKDAFSTASFLRVAQAKLNEFVEEFGLETEVEEYGSEIAKPNHEADFTVEFIQNEEGKPIAMSDLVKRSKQPEPKVWAEKLSSLED